MIRAIINKIKQKFWEWEAHEAHAAYDAHAESKQKPKDDNACPCVHCQKSDNKNEEKKE